MGTGNQTRDSGDTQSLLADIADIAVRLSHSIGFWGRGSVVCDPGMFGLDERTHDLVDPQAPLLIGLSPYNPSLDLPSKTASGACFSTTPVFLFFYDLSLLRSIRHIKCSPGKEEIADRLQDESAVRKVT
jgi:hypothetical protein